MRQVTATEKYRAVNEGRMAKSEFVRQMRQQFPQLVSQYNGYNDTVQILKNKGMLFETKVQEAADVKVYDERPALNYSLDALDRGVRYELTALGLEPGVAAVKKEDMVKATAAAKKNLEKDPLHYLNLLSGESSKVDKNDQYKETKRGKEEKDTFNDMKKANLKEGMTPPADVDVTQEIAEKIAELFTSEDDLGIIYKVSDGLSASSFDLDTEAGPETPGEDWKDSRGFSIDNYLGKYAGGSFYIKKDGDKLVIINAATGGAIAGYADLDGSNVELRPLNMEGTGNIRENVKQVASVIKAKYGEIPYFDEFLKDYLKTHMDDIKAGNVTDPIADFDNYVDVNYDQLEEKKGKDHDGDGDIDSDDYLAAKDKAIKAAMVKESVKSIIKNILSEEMINEAATNELARFAEEYGDFPGMKQAIIQLQDIVTDIESYYDKTRAKIQKVYDTLGDIRNEEGLKVGGFLAPSIESAFNKDLRPVIKTGFTKGLETPKVRTLTQADIDAHNSGERPLGEMDVEEKQTVFTPVNENEK